MANDPAQYASDAIAEMMEHGDFADAYALCLPLAEQGDTHAQLHVGWMLHTGQGVMKDLREAEKWYRLAVGSNSARAKFYMGTLFWNKRDFSRALEWFEKAGADGFSPALYHLARMYRHGIGVDANPTKARDYVDEAARLGHLYARRDVARAMLSGARGIVRIPHGFVSLCRVVWRGYRAAFRDLQDDALLRL
jgi:TPR repeat protein